ncbi:MAG: GDSL-type esterase/lipase family protein [Lachnospiraceae bacterium]|nr:GDSL-type esterase/lipase family protein [Lachnospiraceae bacterium]
MRKWRKTPLLVALLVSMLVIGIVSVVGSQTIYKEYAGSLWRESALVSVVDGMSRGVFPWNTPSSAKGEVTEDEQPVTESLLPVDEIETETEAIEIPETETVEEPKTYEFTHVDQSYFDDAVFIGDSRTVGLRDYSGWDNATYYASIGLTVYDMFTEPIVEEEGRTITVEQALQEHQFGKVYLMIGINEMGTGNVDTFMEAYEEAVEHLRELQPDAIIYVQGIMYIKKSRSDRDPIFNNPAIQERNDRIAELANNQDIFYIDVNEVVTDETGNLNPEYTYDEVHLLGKYYSVWTDFLLEHAIVKE